MELKELYQEIILDHGKNPRNKGKCDGFTNDAKAHNPLCGDKVHMYLKLNKDKEIENLANRIVAEGLTVRAVEEIVATGGAKVKSGGIRSGKIVAPKLKQISEALSDRLDTRVNIELGKKKGKIVIEFATIEDLERINTEIQKSK